MFNYKIRKMKKAVSIVFILGMLVLGSLNTLVAQDEQTERKDTISVDNSDPVFYDAEEESESDASGNGTILAIVGGVVVVGIGAFFLLKKKKS